ncbi:MAG: trypsin-like serine protease [Rhodothermia bacterium]|nr:trypsin-like serine protease [Rhodothermia bacterium]
MRAQLRIIVVASLLLGATPHLPNLDANDVIVTRHDRADSLYLELGKQFGAVGKVGRGGDGTLIAPEWVLTAAHVARGMQRRSKNLEVVLGDKNYSVLQVILHPDWRDMGPHDVALLRLAHSVEDIDPIAVYTGNAELDQIATLVGHGDTRTGLGGEWVMDGERRGATNKVDRVDEQWLYFTFDEPLIATDLEGTPGRGDSGGPALIMADGEWFVAGVSSLGRDGKFGPGTYGAVDHFVRVSSYQDWIMHTMENPPAESVTSAPVIAGESERADQLRKTPAGKHMAAFLEVIAAEGDQDLAKFVGEHFSAGELEKRGADKWVSAMRTLAEELRGARLHRVVQNEQDDIEIVLSTPERGERVLRFRCEPAAPHGITAIMTGRVDSR